MFRFSIRDLLWLTLVVAMGLGWFIRERQLGANNRNLGAEVMAWEARMELLEQRLERQGVKVIWNRNRSDVGLLTKTR